MGRGRSLGCGLDAECPRTRVDERPIGGPRLDRTRRRCGQHLPGPPASTGRAVGGFAVQTLFLAIADLTYRRANLEHAAASLGNMMQGALLVAQMSWLLLAFAVPEWTVGHVHVVTPLLLVSYLYGVRFIRKVQTTPMWDPARTRETREDVPEHSGERDSLRGLVVAFAGLAVTIGAAGWALEKSATVIAEGTGLGQVVVGRLFAAVATSLPELVTTLAAVRRGAFTPAVAGIIGGNAFDSLFAALSDVACLDGSVHHAVSDAVVFWTALGLLMTAFLLMGLIRREEQGPGRIGFESMCLFGFYALGVVVVVAAG